MKKENDIFLENLKEELGKQLSDSEKENKTEIKKLVEKELTEIEKKTEKKLKNLYYWLFGVALSLLVIIIGVFFYLQKPAGK